MVDDEQESGAAGLRAPGQAGQEEGHRPVGMRPNKDAERGLTQP